ncbi:hypothetical protein O3P69_012299 [Scylla paramamosain]|uniref:AMP-dependent synthetase/ligase domain-containing protein n=1 Tax=Scylla paramamosain TaxID=85552 RepID=A0AAW0TDD7_SCYPA
MYVSEGLALFEASRAIASALVVDIVPLPIKSSACAILMFLRAPASLSSAAERFLKPYVDETALHHNAQYFVKLRLEGRVDLQTQRKTVWHEALLEARNYTFALYGFDSGLVLHHFWRPGIAAASVQQLLYTKICQSLERPNPPVSQRRTAIGEVSAMNTSKNKLGKEPRVLSWQGCKPLPTIPDKNFAVFMLEAMAKVVEGDDEAIAVVDAETGKKRTFSELCELVPRMSAGLAAAGVGLGDRVMYYSLNHTDYPLVYLSILHRGATIVHISPIYEGLQEGMMHAMRLSGASWAIVHAELLDQAEAVFSLLPPNTLKKVWVIGGAVDRPAIEDLVGHAPIPPVTQLDGLHPASAVAQMPFSSGTTGSRKGVMISHSNEVSRMIMFK